MSDSIISLNLKTFKQIFSRPGAPSDQSQVDVSKIDSSSPELKGGNDASNEQTLSLRDPSPQQPRTINVVLFGETGVGKSSVINLIARAEIAQVSSDVNGCTMQYNRYPISFDNMNFAIFDTIGLEEPQMGVNGYLKAIEKAYELISRLSTAGGIHLLLFCMRGGRITATTQSNYRLFCECLCHTKVPIALVFTGLERETTMEDWWNRNKKHIEDYGIKSDDHACITAVQDDAPGEDRKYKESEERIREVLKNCARKNEGFSPDSHPWFARLMRGMRGFVVGKKSPKKKDILKVLTHRCKLDPETAKKIAAMMENGEADKNPPLGSGEGEGGKEDSISNVEGADQGERDTSQSKHDVKPVPDAVLNEMGDVTNRVPRLRHVEEAPANVGHIGGRPATQSGRGGDQTAGVQTVNPQPNVEGAVQGGPDTSPSMHAIHAAAAPASDAVSNETGDVTSKPRLRHVEKTLANVDRVGGKPAAQSGKDTDQAVEAQMVNPQSTVEGSFRGGRGGGNTSQSKHNVNTASDVVPNEMEDVTSKRLRHVEEGPANISRIGGKSTTQSGRDDDRAARVQMVNPQSNIEGTVQGGRGGGDTSQSKHNVNAAPEVVQNEMGDVASRERLRHERPANVGRAGGEPVTQKGRDGDRAVGVLVVNPQSNTEGAVQGGREGENTSSNKRNVSAAPEVVPNEAGEVTNTVPRLRHVEEGPANGGRIGGKPVAQSGRERDRTMGMQMLSPRALPNVDQSGRRGGDISLNNHNSNVNVAPEAVPNEMGEVTVTSRPRRLRHVEEAPANIGRIVGKPAAQSGSLRDRGRTAGATPS